MKAFLLYLVMGYLAIAIQATLFSGIKPDLVLVLICFYSLKFGEIKGMTYGALIGLIIDSTNGYVLGPNILSKALAGFLSASIREKFFGWNLFLNTALILLLSVIDNLIVYICLETFTTISFAKRLWWSSLLGVFYTAVAGLTLYPVMAKKSEEVLIK